MIDWGDDSTPHIILEVEESLNEVIDDPGIARMLTVESLPWMGYYFILDI